MVISHTVEAKSVNHISGKGVYSVPVLKTYGSVQFLTLGQLGTKCDTANGVSGGITAFKNNGTCSDSSAKENIARVGTHHKGFGLYLFDYKPEYRQAWGYGRQFGVMANEIELVMPEAVVLHPDGYKMVKYDMLGITPTVH